MSEPVGQRIGCRFCFETLDPEDAIGSKRAIVCCERCQARSVASFYHRECWERSGACVHPGCGGEDARPSKLAAPETLDVSCRRTFVMGTGPLNSMDDRPLGISKGTLVCDNGKSRQLSILNNSDKPLSIDRAIGPVWASIRFELPNGDGKPPLTSGIGRILLKPRQQVQLVLRPKIFRPRNANQYIPLNGEQGFETQSHQFGGLYACGIAFLLLFAAIHCIAMLFALADPGDAAGGTAAKVAAATLGIIAAGWGVACSSLVRRILLRLVAAVESSTGWLMVPTSWKPSLVDGLEGRPADRRVKLVVLAMVFGVSTALFAWLLGKLVWSRWMSHGGVTTGFGVLLAWAYILAWAVALVLWLRAYGFDVFRATAHAIGKLEIGPRPAAPSRTSGDS